MGIFNIVFKENICYYDIMCKSESCEISVADFPWQAEETLLALVS